MILEQKWNPGLIVLSFIIACVGSGTALMFAEQAVTKVKLDLPHPNIQIALGGLCLAAIGIWSMHTIGMVALDIGHSMYYAPENTIGGLIVACVFVTTAFWLALGAVRIQQSQLLRFESSLSRSVDSRSSKEVVSIILRRSLNPRLLFGGVCAGLGVAAMHYTHTLGIRSVAHPTYDAGLVALSILIAIVAATAALVLAFYLSTEYGALFRVLSAVVMAIAVCGMHYTGMSSITWHLDENIEFDPTGLWDIDSLYFAVFVIIGIVWFLTTLLVDRLQKSEWKFNRYVRKTQKDLLKVVAQINKNQQSHENFKYLINVCRPIMQRFTFSPDRQRWSVLDESTSGDETGLHKTYKFDDFLENPATLEIFKDFCTRSMCLEEIMFYVRCKHIQSLQKSEQLIAMAEVLDEFVFEESPNQINLPNKLVKKIRAWDRKSPAPSLLDGAMSEIFRLVKNGPFVNFQTLPDYKLCCLLLQHWDHLNLAVSSPVSQIKGLADALKESFITVSEEGFVERKEAVTHQMTLSNIFTRTPSRRSSLVDKIVSKGSPSTSRADHKDAVEMVIEEEEERLTAV